MADQSNPIAFKIKLSSPDHSDPEAMDRLTRNLRSGIQEIGLESVQLGVDETKADGSKGAGAVLPGILVLNGMIALMPKVLEYLQSWIMRGQNQAVSIEIQRGANKVNLSFTPKSTSPEDILNLVEKLNQNLK